MNHQYSSLFCFETRDDALGYFEKLIFSTMKVSVESVSLNRGSPALLQAFRFETEKKLQISKHGTVGLLGQYQHHKKNP